MITVWGRRSSSNVQAVMWCIAELGLAHERIDAGYTYGVTDTAEYLSMNPNGRVPTIQDGDNKPLWESGAIIRYLSNAYGSSPFWPDHVAQRAIVDQWAEWSKINIALSFTSPIFWQVVRKPADQRDPEQVRASIKALEKWMQTANSRLQTSRYLAGDDLTLADIQFAHVLYRYFDIDIERTSLPEIENYYERMTQRPAYREHVMVPYDELRNSM